MTLLFVLLARLAGTGMFDASLATRSADLTALSPCSRDWRLPRVCSLADTIVPVNVAWPWAARWLHRGLIALVVVSLLAYLGVPGAADLRRFAVVVGSAGITAYLVHRGRFGAQAARVLAPSAAVFALVALAAAASSHRNPGQFRRAPDMPAALRRPARSCWRSRWSRARASPCCRSRGAMQPARRSFRRCRPSAPRIRASSIWISPETTFTCRAKPRP